MRTHPSPKHSADRTAKRPSLSANAPSSWMALVAATTLGLSNVEYVRTTVASRAVAPELRDRSCRLIVQSYARGSVASDHIAKDAKPLASAQRAITAEELERGVSVDLVHMDAPTEEAPLVVAWLELGEPDLEFDARTARPAEGALFGLQQATHGRSSLVVLRTQRALN